jgi:hypothetical protein
MKKAIAYINKKALIQLLKIPYRIELVGMEYPSKDDRIKITLSGEQLPVQDCGPNSKRFPEIKYTVMHHWHNAKIEPTENIIEENGDETKSNEKRKRKKDSKLPVED